tara:strand:+ start:51 stop:638 length:588 start_codon:yes stop_codon:yes gene_type:complete
MSLKLIIGLGNPGDDYVDTRHNIGFKFINAMIKASSVDVSKKATLKSHLYQVTVNDSSLICIKPQTYMNLSGEAVKAVMNFYKIEPNEICIVTDDLDIELGTVRVRKQGGAGTHNGMKSVIQMLGTQDFMRLRLGIGPKPEFMDSKDFVLQRFRNEEQTALPDMLNNIRDLFLNHMDDSVDVLMNRINGVEFLNR